MSYIQFATSIFQLVPEFRGKRRLCKLLMKIAGLSKAQNISISTKSGQFELPNLVEIISFDLFVNGAYEKGLVKMLSSSIPEQGVFVDVGANIGSISIPLALVRPDIKIISIEASPWIYSIFQKNLSLNKVANITPLNYAVYSDSGKELKMYAPKDLFGKGSLKPVYTNESESILTITIDDIAEKFSNKKIDFIKVDVEGFEAAVFQGMRRVIQKDRPRIIFEYAGVTENDAGFKAGTAQSLLLEKNYQLQQLDHDFVPIGRPLAELINVQSSNILAQ